MSTKPTTPLICNHLQFLTIAADRADLTWLSFLPFYYPFVCTVSLFSCEYPIPIVGSKQALFHPSSFKSHVYCAAYLLFAWIHYINSIFASFNSCLISQWCCRPSSFDFMCHHEATISTLFLVGSFLHISNFLLPHDHFW